LAGSYFLLERLDFLAKTVNFIHFYTIFVNPENVGSDYIVDYTHGRRRGKMSWLSC